MSCLDVKRGGVEKEIGSERREVERKFGARRDVKKRSCKE